jgi:hypothetical protein
MQKVEGDFYKNLPDGAHELKEAYLPDCVELLVQGFSHSNEIWSSANIDKNVLRTFFTNETRWVMDAQARLREYRNDSAYTSFVRLFLYRSM